LKLIVFFQASYVLHVIGSSKMISMRTIFIHVRNLGAPFMRYHFINKWPYFEYPGIQPHSDFLYWLWLPHRWSH